MLNSWDAHVLNIVTTGTLTNCSMEALILCDSGVTHSLGISIFCVVFEYEI